MDGDGAGSSDSALDSDSFGTAADPAAPAPIGGRKAAILTLVGIVVLMVVVLGVALAPKGKPADGVLPTDPSGFAAPALSLPRLDGQGELSLASLKGEPVVINFWASWCTTCKAEAQTLVDAEKKWRDQGVVFLGVDAVDKDDAAKAFEDQYGIEYPSVVDPKGTTAAQWRVTAYPESFFIGRDGRIVSAVRTGLDPSTLDENIAAIAG
jgi:cytochrome c biogenesis protein CcmG/thiol:disulfide interchange protein DsbE